MINIYSCQNCQKGMETEKEYQIIRGYSPLCSNRCLFIIYYRIIARYDKKTLVCIADLLGIKDFSDLTQQRLVFEVCKKYPKPLLSSVNKEVSRISIKK